MARSWKPDASFDSGPINRGGDGWVVRPRFSPDQHGESINRSNAFLERRGSGGYERVFMWVNEITSDFQLAGSMGQSKRRRTFFPHNFVQPSMMISGQTPNSYEYNRLARFIRQCQLDAVRLDIGEADNILRFRLFRTGPATKRHHRGRHASIDVDGYVKLIATGAERYVNAPDYNFEFVITKANRPAGFVGLADDVITSRALATIGQVIRDPNFNFKFQKQPKVLRGQGLSREQAKELQNQFGPLPDAINDFTEGN